jgi:hypothetical protein
VSVGQVHIPLMTLCHLLKTLLVAYISIVFNCAKKQSFCNTTLLNPSSLDGLIFYSFKTSLNQSFDVFSWNPDKFPCI